MAERRGVVKTRGLPYTSSVNGLIKGDDVAESNTDKPIPNADLKVLEKLVGTWQWSGSIEGSSTYEWAEGGFFMVHHFEFTQAGQQVKGIEFLGHEKPMGTESSKEIKTRIYGYLDGLTQDYVYDATGGDTYTVWLGEKGSEIYMQGTFSNNGNTNSIEWTFPGGSYSATAQKV